MQSLSLIPYNGSVYIDLIPMFIRETVRSVSYMYSIQSTAISIYRFAMYSTEYFKLFFTKKIFFAPFEKAHRKCRVVENTLVVYSILLPAYILK